MAGEIPDKSKQLYEIGRAIEKGRLGLQVPEIVMTLEEYQDPSSVIGEAKERLANLMALSESRLGKIIFRWPDGTEEVQAIINEKIPELKKPT